MSKQTISVIIPTYNRSAVVKELVNCFAKQRLDESFDYEIIVVDNNSNDDTRAVVESCLPQFAGKLTYLFEPRQGKVFALNSAIQKTRGDVVAFIDDDCLIDEDYLQNLNKYFVDYPQVGFLGGRILPKWVDGSGPSWLKDIYPDPHLEKIAWQGADRPSWLDEFFLGPLGILNYGNNPRVIDYSQDTYSGKLFYGANMAFRRNILDQYGLFKKGHVILEDTEICLRLFRAGVKGLYAPNVKVYHKIENWRLNADYYYRWHYGRGKEMELSPDYVRKFYHPLGIPFAFIAETLRYLKYSLSTNSFHQKVFCRSQWFYNLGQMLKILKKNLV